VGKTALLDYLAERASGCRIVRAAGVQSEMELAFAALHQLVAPLLDRLDSLPGPQREALQTAFGVRPALAPPDRFLVSLGVLSLLSEAAGDEPVICLVDDEQWLDRASVQVLALVARRLVAESVGMVFAARGSSDDLVGIPGLLVEGLKEADAGELLDSVLRGPLDASVRARIVAETRGNPLALLELPRGLTPDQLAGGFGLPGAGPLSGRIEEAFSRRLGALPPETRRLLLVAAADPVGEPGLVWRAAKRLGVAVQAATPAEEAGLLGFSPRVLFRHPMVRTVAYRSASVSERQQAHRALADETDPDLDPDRRAWHQAQGAPGPDEAVAEELERSAGRAQSRGGLAAAAAFLERAAMLTLEPDRRVQRLLAAARAKCDAGSLDASLGLLVAVEAGPPDPMRIAEAEHLRGQIALVQRRGNDAARLLLSAAKRLEPIDVRRARETHLEALGAALWADDLEHRGRAQAAARAALAAPANPEPQRAVDVLLDAFALRLTKGYAPAAPLLLQALKSVLDTSVANDEVGRWAWLAGVNPSAIVTLELWDDESLHVLSSRLTRLARDTGALVHLQYALDFLARTQIRMGELAEAASTIDEDCVIADVTGNPPVMYAPLMLAAWRGAQLPASELIAATVAEATARGLGRVINFADYATSVLNNGLGRHEEALDAARRAFERDQLGNGPHVVAELAEAASRSHDRALVGVVADWLAERTRAAPTQWVLGIEARVAALLSEGEEADSLYRASLAHLGRTRVRPELARSHLLYGEWLRRQRRRLEGRVQLRAAYDLLADMGCVAFAERAGRELMATGETVRSRSAETTSELTAQETQIARLARDGLTNPEIAARLFISPRTVQYHLRKVFAKLDIRSRNQLRDALAGEPSSRPR
jgi:DNA-binding CsgD family transcriptional regulator